MRRLAVFILLVVAVVAGLGVDQRRYFLVQLYARTLPPVELSEAGDEGNSVEWIDDYYTIEWIDEQTVAIGEPRYWQQNYSYLILGADRALLFDSGPGERDIRPLVQRLTALPVLAVPSHFHYDHLGGHTRFRRIGVIDLPHLRARAEGNVIRAKSQEHLGFLEDKPSPWLHVTEWLEPGSDIDLGQRTVRVLHTPGHTKESIMLYDSRRDMLFTGDTITEGPVIAFVPGSSLADYLSSTRRVLDTVRRSTRLLTAHRAEGRGAPILAYADLQALHDTIAGIKEGTASATGTFPRVYPVNDNLELMTDFALLERW